MRSTMEGDCDKKTNFSPSSSSWQSTIQCLLDMATDLGYLIRSQDRFARLITFLYADDATIFMSSSASEVVTTTQLLLSFGNVLGLNTNF